MNWIDAALGATVGLTFGPFLILVIVVCIALLLSPVVFALWGKAPLREGIGVGLVFCVWVGAVILHWAS